MATIITGATIDRKTGEMKPICQEVTHEEFIAYIRPLLEAAKILQRHANERATKDTSTIKGEVTA